MARSFVALALVAGMLAPLSCAPAAAPVVRAPEVVAAPVALPSLSQLPVVMEPRTPSEENAAVPISASDPTWGNRTAPVTIVLFADFQCPFCGKLAHTFASIKSTYGPSVRIVWKNNPLPFHPNAKPAAEAAAGVAALGGNDAFWRFHDLAFENQKDLSPQSYAAVGGAERG